MLKISSECNEKKPHLIILLKGSSICQFLPRTNYFDYCNVKYSNRKINEKNKERRKRIAKSPCLHQYYSTVNVDP